MIREIFNSFSDSLKEIRDHEEQMAQLSVIFGNKDKAKELAGFAYAEAIKTTLPNSEVVKITLKKVYRDGCSGKNVSQPVIVDFIQWLSINFYNSYGIWLLKLTHTQMFDFEVIDRYEALRGGKG